VSKAWHLLSKLTRGSDLGNILMLSSLTLAIIVIFQWIGYQPYSSSQNNSSQTNHNQTIQLAQFSTRSIREFQSTIKQPVFYQNRQPISGGSTNKPLGTYYLTGVMIIPGKRLAILKNKRSGEEKQVAEGKNHNGWTVYKVEKGQITLQQGSRQEIVKLSTNTDKNRSNSRNSSYNRNQNSRNRRLNRRNNSNRR